MNSSASRLSAPALLAVLFMLPTALHAASRSEVASPTSFQLLSSVGPIRRPVTAPSSRAATVP